MCFLVHFKTKQKEDRNPFSTLPNFPLLCQKGDAGSHELLEVSAQLKRNPQPPFRTGAQIVESRPFSLFMSVILET